MVSKIEYGMSREIRDCWQP